MTHLQDNNVQAQLDAEAFRRDLTALIPKMRAYARSMCGRDASEGDDLAQEALLKAWLGRGSYTPGTNLKAWVFMILRNQFYSDKRRSWRQQQLDQETAEATLVAIDNPMDAIELDELRRAIAMLPDEQREALILIGAGGFSYEEVAEMCGAATGTV
ncbi:MAG TPA: sigma-70 family RNA polymerase sigma factor, partial [Phenylobacterium sp.]|nr:sigma-70 family RNA polymerase sigma factor [Phenylobacterium sp.]